jgi:hypothetical protein
LVTLTIPGTARATVWLQASQTATGNYTAATATTSFTVFPTLTLTASTLPTGVVKSPYNQSLVSFASGGDGSLNYSWSTNSTGTTNLSTLGLTLNPNGTVTGTPTAKQTGTVSFSATVNDTIGNTATATMQVTINASLSVSTTTLPYGITGAGASYSQPLTAAGGTGSYTSWAVTTGGSSLASLGLSLNTGTGVISNGSSTLIAGSATITVTVTDSSGATALSSPLTINIYAPLALPTPSATEPGPAIFSQGYGGSINVTGGSGSYSWSITNSGLTAAGLTYATTGGTPAGSQMYISGTAPSTAQTIDFTVQVTDTVTHLYTSAIQYSIVVGPQTPLTLQPASNTALSPGATTNESYTNSQIYLTNGSNSGYAFTVGVNGAAATTGTSWTLPYGLTASSSNGVLTISGKSTQAQTITLAVSGTDSGKDTAGPSTYTLAVTNPAPLAFVPSAGALAAATISQSYSNAINVTGGDQTNYTWTVNGTAVSGTPLAIDIGATSTPSGITVSTAGGNMLSINGPCTAYGTATLNVSVLDVGTSQTISPAVPYTIACNPQQPLALTPSSNPLPSGTYNPSGVSSYPGAQIYASGGSGSGYAFSVTVDTVTTVVGAGMTMPIGDGLTVSASGGTLSIGGTPTQAGDVPLNVTLNDSAGDPVASATYEIAIINPAAGYTVSGNISYSGTKTGWIYIRLINTGCNGNGGCGNSGLGTAISAPGAFTINGVTPGDYRVQAWMDAVGYGAANAGDPSTNPLPNVNLTVTNQAVNGVSVTLADPPAVSLNSSPTWDPSQGSGTFSTGAFVYFDSIQNSNGVEIPTSYNVEYSTSPTFATGAGILSGSQSFAAIGGNSPWIVTGLTTGDTYYFRAAGVVGSGSSAVTGPYSAISSGIAIGATPAGSVAVSVTVNFTGTATGPLYVGFYNPNTGQIYATVAGSSAAPPKTGNSYTVYVPAGSSYFLFGIIDQNNTGLINAPGEISNTNESNMTLTAITSSTTSETLTLPSGNSVAVVRTRNSQQTGLNGVTANNYGLDFRVNGLLKLPVSVELQQGTTAVPGVVVPTDIATGAFNGNTDEFDYSPNLNGDIPAQGDSYKLFVTYSDSTAAVPDTQTFTVTVGAPLNAFATLNSPTGTGVSTEPNFSWSYPASASSSDTYSFQLSPSNGGTVWEIPAQHSSSNGFSSTVTPAITWGIDPTGTGDLPSVPILNSDTAYWWQITTTDTNGDEATSQVEFQTFGTALSLPATNPISLPGTTNVNFPYIGSVTVTGGVGPYNWQVNNLSDNLYWNTNSADNATLYINGTPNQTGTVTFQVTVYDSTGASYGPVTYIINVQPAATGGYPVVGEINFNGCEDGNEPPVTLTLSQSVAPGAFTYTTVTNGDGNYQFYNIPNGTYTLTPSASTTGATSSAFVPATQTVVVNNSNVYNWGEFKAYLGYTVSGVVGYDGSDSGQIYLAMNGCSSPTPGTSISAPGAFTIRGVPPGNYTLQAWMDNKSVVSGQQLGGYGVQNASNPTGSTSVLVTDANVPDVSVGLTNSPAVTLSSASALFLANGFANGAVLNINPVYIQNSAGNWAEAATSYTVQWSVANDFSSVAGSASFPASGYYPGYWILNTASIPGLTQGATYYFRVQGVAGSSTSNWSKVAGPVIISAPPTANTVSGQITFTQKAKGPLYVGFFDQNAGQAYLTQVGSAAAPPTSPASYSLQVPSGNNYFLFAFIDQNNDGMIDAGDITNINTYNMITPPVAISSATTQNLTLPSANSWTIMQTANSYGSTEWGASGGYGLGFIVSTQNKMPVAVALLSGSNVLSPMDFALCQQCSGDPNARFTSESLILNGSIAPTVGNVYSVQVTYSDGTSETLHPQITNVLPNYPTNLSPAGPQSATNPTPTLTWNYPDTNAASYFYQMWFADDNWNTVWSIPNIYSTTNPFTTATVPTASIKWGTDPTDPANTPAVSSLTNGEVYYWMITAYDANGNSADYLTDYVPGYTAVALPSTNPSTLGSPVLNHYYTGSITATGGYGGYSYAVNGSSCYGCSFSLGDNLTANTNNGALQITGTPNATGPVTFTVEAQDTSGAKSASVQYAINITAADGLSLPVPNPSSLGPAVVGLSYFGSISASGGVGPYSWQTSAMSDYLGWYQTGNNNISIAFNGTPTYTTTVSFTATVTDSTGASYGPVTYTIAVNPAVPETYAVIGAVNFNGCDSGNEPPVTLTISETGSTTGFTAQTTTTDATGNYQFPSIPNGSYTITPSISGPTSIFSPVSQPVTVDGSSQTANFNAYLGYTVSGQVNYGGADTGQVYVSLGSCGNTTLGTSISAPGTFTVHGVPPGNYTLNAWMDSKSVVSGQQLGGYGVQNASDPTGTVSNVLVPSAEITDLSVAMANPSAVTLGSAPTWSGQAFGAFSGGAFVSFTPIKNSSNVEIPTSYTLEYSTDPTFTTGVASRSFAATGGNNGGLAGSGGIGGWKGGNSPWIVTGLTNNDTYYFRAAGVVGSGSSAVTGVWSDPSPGILIGAPSSGNAVSGTVTFSTPTGGSITGPLYVGFWNQNTGSIYAEEIASPVSSQNYGPINVPTGTNYFFFGFIDQNNDGMIDPGDITNAFGYNMTIPSVAISGTTTQNLTLPSANSSTAIITENDEFSSWSGTSQNYALDLIVTTGNKLPVSVELTSGSNVLAPMDIGLCQGCGYDPNGRFFGDNIQLNSALAPTVGNAYGLKVGYSDGTSEALTPHVTNVLPNGPTSLLPAGAVESTNTSPTFTWNYPDSLAGSYLYQFFLYDSAYGYASIWSVPNIYSASNPFNSSVASIPWGADPTDPNNKPAVSALTDGSLYYSQMAAYDSFGNRANYGTDFELGYTALALPAANPSSLGSATLGQPYHGSITATGGYFSWNGYVYSVNCSNCFWWGNISLGNGLTIASTQGNSSGALQITGTPTATGTVSFQVYVEDASGAVAGPVTYTININEPPVSLSGTGGTISAFVGQSFSQTIAASGGSGSEYTFTVSVDGGVYGSVPLALADGLSASANGNTLTISGTPGTAATVFLSIYAKDGQGNNTTQSDTINVVSPPSGANNKYLSGTYVCKFDGFEDRDGARITSLFSFKANGAAGTFTGGVFDTNSRDFPAEMSGTITGTYSIGADNNGVAATAYSVTAPAADASTGTNSWAIALNDTSPLTTATEFRMVEIDDVGSNPSGQTGTGDCYQANTGVFGTDVFTGNSFVFSLSGEDGSGNPQVTLGRFYNASGTATGSITGGVIDQAKITNTSVTEMTLTGGTYTTPDATNGRSMLTVLVSGGSATLEVYVIDANRMFIIQTADTRAQSGDMRKQQQAAYSGANLSGPFVLYTQGAFEYLGTSGWTSGVGSYVLQGTGDGTGNLTVKQSYYDLSGSYTVGAENGGPTAVTFDPSNPGRATIATGAIGGSYLYFFNDNNAFYLKSPCVFALTGDNLCLAAGGMEPQSETTFTNAAVAGTYLFGQLPQTEASSKGGVGEFILSSSGCTTSGGVTYCPFTGDATTGGEGSFSYDQSIGSMTYNWDATVTGTGSYLVGTSPKGLSCVVISATKDVCIFDADDRPSVAILQQ